MAVECVGNAFESVEFYRYIRIPKLLDEALTALYRNCDVFETMKNCRRRKSGRNVCCRCCSAARLFRAARRQHTRGDVGGRIISETNRYLRAHTRIPAGALELGPICCSGGEQRVVSACGITDHPDTLRFNAKSLCIGADPADRGLRVMNECRISSLTAEPIL